MEKNNLQAQHILANFISYCMEQFVKNINFIEVEK